MNVARILYPVEVLGPGSRVGIWVAGCEHHCVKCSNPELWSKCPEFEIEVQSLVEAIRQSIPNDHIDGFVITGGDPFYQAEELAELLPILKAMADDILVYTGFTYEELLSADDMAVKRCLDEISVLVDGPYVDALNDGSLLRGSNNQSIIYLDESIKPKYQVYFDTYRENKIQNFSVDGGVVSVGIHKRDFANDIVAAAKKKGVMPHE